MQGSRPAHCRHGATGDETPSGANAPPKNPSTPPRNLSPPTGVLECARHKTRVRPWGNSSPPGGALEYIGGRTRVRRRRTPRGRRSIETSRRAPAPLWNGCPPVFGPARGGRRECGIISPPSCALPAHWQCLPGTRRRRARAGRCLRPARRRGAERRRGWRRASGRWPPRCGGRRTIRRC